MKKKLAVVVIVATLGIGGFYWWQQSNRVVSEPSPAQNLEDEVVPSMNEEPKTQPTFNKEQFSLSEPSSPWVIVNKRRAIPISYRPDLTVPNVRLRLSASEQQMQVSQQAAEAVKDMFTAASNDGVTLVFGSGYRSGSLQQQFYSSYVAKDGRAAADRYSARPGHSEHQTGLGIDITSPSGQCHLQICWEDTPQGKWVAANAYKYGFVLRYPNGKEAITGYQYEPWHFRYVGKELAAEVKRTGQTLEEFFGLPPAPSYD